MRSSSHFELFLAREQRRNQSAYEREVLARWLQLLASQRQIYDVSNTHRCFDPAQPTHRPAHVVRPFASVPHFYGCLQCGRSHHCWGERGACEIVYSSQSECVEVCRYSGRVIKNQDNLRATYEDTSRRRPSLKNYVASSRCPSIGEPRRPDRATRHRQRTIKSLSVKREQKRRSSSRRHRKERNHSLLLQTQLENYELSIESLTSGSSGSNSGSRSECSEDSREEEEKGEEESNDTVESSLSGETIGSRESQEDEEEEGVENNVTHKRKRDDNDDGDDDDAENNERISGEGDWSASESMNEHDNNEEGEDNNNETGKRGRADEAGEDEGELRGEDSGTTAGFIKNYHNNLQYNNEKYAFMRGVIRKWRREKDEAQVFRRELRESRRLEAALDQRVEREPTVVTATTKPLEEAPPDEPDRQFALKKQLRNKIYTECELLLRELLARQSALQHLAACQQFYAPLLCNIAALVYASEKLGALTLTRTHKNQKQQKNTAQLLKLGLSTIDCGHLDSLQSDAEYHEYTLEPRRLCRVLLHYLLLQPLSLRDSIGNRVDLWQRDAWLTHATALLPAVERDRRELQAVCDLVRECLTSYARCPYWARAMIFWPEET